MGGRRSATGSTTARPEGARHSEPPRPRYARIAAAGGSLLVTLVAVLGAVGILPTATLSAQAAPVQAAQPAQGAMQLTGSVHGSLPRQPAPARTSASATPAPPVPADTGEGKRVVFDRAQQRVWLVDADGSVARTYLVSGSLTDNLHAGHYTVESRQLHAIGIDNSGTMDYFVVFTHGVNAAIGFHDIPVKDGRPLQTRAQLGSPQSHGCIRQWEPDAKALWRFAPMGTPVVVV